jgi:uncharacterized repeat protein (TIGR03847 family)
MIDYGLVDAIDAQSIGPPGQRTFRVRIQSGQNRASLWFEKEQLAALARAISQLLADHSKLRGRPAEPAPAVDDFEVGDVELQVARLGLDFVAEAEQVVMLVDDREAIERSDTPAFRAEITRAMAMSLVEAIPDIVAAGRPTCPLCGRPIEGSGQHFCPQTNGHSKDLPIPEEPSSR